MMEHPPNIVDSGNEKKKLLDEYLALAKDLSKDKEGFPFPGIDPESYLKIKAADEEFPGYTTPIDELIERFKNEGMKVVLSEPPRNRGNREVFILPLKSNEIQEDSIRLKDLHNNETLSNEVKNLISLSENLK